VFVLLLIHNQNGSIYLPHKCQHNLPIEMKRTMLIKYKCALQNWHIIKAISIRKYRYWKLFPEHLLCVEFIRIFNLHSSPGTSLRSQKLWWINLMINYDVSYVSCISHLLKFVTRIGRYASNLVTYAVKIYIYIHVPNICHYVCHMFVAAELLIRDFHVYTAELSHTDFMPNTIKATVKCLNIFTELYVQYIYSYTLLQHLFFISPS